MAIQGRLSEMSLPTLVQMTCQEGNRAQLSIRQNDSEALLYFDRGNVVHAEMDGYEGEEVVYRLLAWQDGEFSLESGVVPPARTIESAWTSLLMDGLQRLDEERWDTMDMESIEEGYDMAENLRDILTELGGQVPGFVAASVVGMDGLGIAEHTASPVNMESINAQLTLLIKLVDTSVGKLTAGSIEDNLLTTDKTYILFRFLSGNDYYLALAADRQTANLGSMRLYSRIFAERLDKAMPR